MKNDNSIKHPAIMNIGLVLSCFQAALCASQANSRMAAPGLYVYKAEHRLLTLPNRGTCCQFYMNKMAFLDIHRKTETGMILSMLYEAASERASASTICLACASYVLCINEMLTSVQKYKLVSVVDESLGNKATFCIVADGTDVACVFDEVTHKLYVLCDKKPGVPYAFSILKYYLLEIYKSDSTKKYTFRSAGRAISSSASLGTRISLRFIRLDDMLYNKPNKEHAMTEKFNKEHAMTESCNKEHTMTERCNKEHAMTERCNKEHTMIERCNKEHTMIGSCNKEHTMTEKFNRRHKITITSIIVIPLLLGLIFLFVNK